MTRFIAALLILLAAALPACDSTTPLTSNGEKTVEVRFVVMATSVFEADVWDRYTDTNRNGTVDAGEPRAGFACGDFFSSSFGVSKVPWTFTVDMRIVRGGTVVQQVLTAANAFNSYLSATDEDSRVITGQSPAQPPSVEAGFAYNNPRRVPDGSYAYLSACVTDVFLPVFGQVGGLPTPLEIVLAEGDTLIVSAGQNANGIIGYDSPQELHADVFVDGSPLTAENVEGSLIVGSNGVLRFSYQNR